MLRDEEREAIERVELFIDGERQYNTKTGEAIIPYEYGESQRFVYKETYYAIQVVLNLIEKQSKEIEELKITKKELTERVLRLESDEFWNNVVSKDKIKPIQIIDLDGKIHNVYKIEEE